jgi:hypothetical protein
VTSRVRARTFAALAIVVVAAFGVAAAQAPEPAASPSANAIFDRARSVANTRAFPAYYSYRLDTRIERKGKVLEEHDRVTVRHSDGVSFVEPIKDSPSDRRATTPEVRPSPPYVAPGRTFGLATTPVRAGPSIFDEQPDAAASPSPAPAATTVVIGRVVATSRDYDVTLAGEAVIDGRDTYHLIVVPRFAPERKLLRELYIDRTTFRAVREIIQVAPNAGPIHTRPLATIDYQDFGDGYLMAVASAHVELRVVFLSFTADVSLRMSELTAVEHPPPWMFDAALLSAHLREAHAR